MNRRSGRTTRLLHTALSLAAKGKSVFVLGATATHADILHSLCRALVHQPPAAVPSLFPYGGGVIHFKSLQAVNLDWTHTSLRLMGTEPGTEVLIDHFAIETEFGPILHMLHAFDPEAR